MTMLIVVALVVVAVGLALLDRRPKNDLDDSHLRALARLRDQRR